MERKPLHTVATIKVMKLNQIVGILRTLMIETDFELFFELG